MSTFIDIVVLELCGVLPVAVLCHMVWWSARRLRVVNFFFGKGSLDFDDQFSGCQWFFDYKRYVNHCKRGGIGVPEKGGGCSPPHPPHSSSLVRLAPPPQHLLLTLRGGALPSPLVAHSMYTIHYTIRNIHCQQKHITSLWRVRANKTWKHLSRVTDQELWVRVCKKMVLFD